MKRMIFLVIRLLYRIPGWLLTIHRYNKHKEDVSFETRFDFTQRLIRKVNENQESIFIALVKKIYQKNRDI